MHILIINNGLASGGTERHSLGIANEFVDKGCKVTILATYPSNHFFKLRPEISFIEPNFQRNNTNKYIYLVKLIFYIRKNIKKISPDIILSFNEWTNAYVILASLGLNTSVYVAEMMHPDVKLPMVTYLLKAKLYAKANGVITQTSYGKEVVERVTGSKNTVVIPNPINLIERKPCEKRKIIISVGRLEVVKGHNLLLEAFALLNDKSWNLHIVGDGSLKELLIKKAIELGISDRVNFLGMLSDFSYELSEAEIFVLPSLKEGFPNALIEAMSVPLACISGDYYPGNNDLVVNGENGLLFQPGSVQSLLEALMVLTKDSALRDKLSKNAYLIRDKLDSKKIASQYLDFIIENVS